MQLYYIRHAQSENNALWDRTGADIGRSEDPKLTDIGVQQAETLAKFLAKAARRTSEERRDTQDMGGFQLTHLYSSLMERSVMTGTAVSKAIGVPLEGWLDLHETGGIFLWDEEKEERVGLPGKTPSFFKTRYPEFMLPEDVSHNGWWNRPFELDEEQIPRAKRVIERLLERHGETEDRVAMISHGGFFNVFMSALLGLDVKQHIWFTMNNVAITRIDFRPNRVYVVYTNRVDFLRPELIT
jgi:2,3-bisphosphoglycerate-dependent phosphoglycerate mutase